MKSNLGIKILIWLYLVLLIFEGSLRKWVLPGLSAPLLVVRDPVLLGIYAFSLSQGSFPNNGALRLVGFLAVASGALAMVLGHGNLVVTLFGIRADYLHLPLVWIMGSVLTRRDLLWMGAFVMVIALPNTLLMVKQYNAAPDDWYNWGAGGAGTGQINGSGEHVRPAGFFSFISGPASLYPLVMAFAVYCLLGTQHLLRIVAIGAAVATAVAIPVSISRSVFLSVVIVAITGIMCAVVSGKIATNTVKVAVLVGVLAIAIPRIPVFHDALQSFTDRWELATEDVKTDIGWRWASTFLEAFEAMGWAPFFGNGVGSGTNVAAGVAAGNQSMFFGEGEWGRAVGELGPVVGFTFLGFRTWLTAYLVVLALGSWKKYSDPLSLLLCSAGGMWILIGQWGIPTSHGFAIFGAGLMLAAAKTRPESLTSTAPVTETAEMSEGRRFRPLDNDRRPPAVAKPVRA